MSDLEGIARRIEAVRERIANACARAGRSPDEVTLIAVSKTHGADAVKAAWRAGVSDFGENRVQEALPKIEELEREFGAGAGPAFHLIGHLQTNKARAAAGPFAILHGIDSERILRAVSEQATAPVRLMLQVNVSGELSKHGMTPDKLPSMVDLARSLPRVELEGLMTIAPLGAEGDEVRNLFRKLRTMGETHGLKALSMGMTDDFEVAIEEGSTHVRVGRAIFGERSA